jgi:hypothetical protein
MLWVGSDLDCLFLSVSLIRQFDCLGLIYMKSKADLVISWRAIAIGATTVALAALAGLTVVSTIKSVDTLSVVALAVAIVAFVIQILVFIAQAAASSQQELRAQELYGSTMSILSTIEEKTEGTRRDVSTINEKMLGAILGKAISETRVSTPPESADFGEVVAEKVARMAISDITVSENSQGETFLLHSSNMYTFPMHTEVRRILPGIKVLSPTDLLALAILGQDQEQFDSGRQPYAGFNVANPDQLLQKGFVREDYSPQHRGPVHVLTDDGRIAARVLLAHDVPADEKATVTDIRASARSFDRGRGFRVFQGELPPEG